jgi:hypothetical protein
MITDPVNSYGDTAPKLFGTRGSRSFLGLENTASPARQRQGPLREVVRRGPVIARRKRPRGVFGK